VLLLGEKRNTAVQALGRAVVQVFGKSCCADFWEELLCRFLGKAVVHVFVLGGRCWPNVCWDSSMWAESVLPLERIVSKAMNYMAASSTLMLLMSSTSMYKKNESIYFHGKKNESSFLLECNSTKIETIFSPWPEKQLNTKIRKRH